MEDTVVKCETTDFLNFVTKLDSDGNTYIVVEEKALSLSSKVMGAVRAVRNWIGSIIL